VKTPFMEQYEKEISPALTRKFKYKNVMQVPRLTKITVNMGLGEAIQNIKALDAASSDMALIAGQKPVITKASKSIASFKLRKGMPIGCMVTLRRERMYEFYQKLVTIVLPRVRDFKGISPKAFDGRGNYTLGLKEQIIFPEIEYDKVDRVRGMNITITTTADTDEEAFELLKLMGMPFRS
jgi:large subunit ribosomal protein L5